MDAMYHFSAPLTSSMKTLLLISLLFASTAIAAEKPHIVFVMADDQGWGQTSYNHHPDILTPHLDEMAANGLRFNSFLCRSIQLLAESSHRPDGALQ